MKCLNPLLAFAAAGLAALLAGCQPVQKDGVTPTTQKPFFGSTADSNASNLKKSTILGSTPQAPPAQIDPTKVDEKDDITEIFQYWPPAPVRVDNDGAPVGFKVAVYLASGETEKGAFVPGTIYLQLYEVGRALSGKSKRELLHTWQFDRNGAMPYRVRKKSVTGYFYGFILNWPPELELAGKTVDVEIAYEATSGRVVTSAPHRFQVPLPGVSADGVAARPDARVLPPSRPGIRQNSDSSMARRPTAGQAPPRTEPRATPPDSARSSSTSRPKPRPQVPPPGSEEDGDEPK